VNDGLTIDFDEWTDPFPMIHYCFRVSQDDFNIILERIKAAGIPSDFLIPAGILAPKQET
jgi:hypothetical protein